MNITILGAGNVATQLALAFKKAGHTVVEIYNRSSEAGEELAKTVGARFTSNIQQLLDAELYVIAVKDDAIAERAATLNVNDKVVVHTSGTKSSALLKQSSVNYGIFYPLQTMTKAMKVDFKSVPILIEGSNTETTQLLERLGFTISQNVHRVDEEQRQWIHLAAVFANNFTNHLYGISEKLMLAHHLPFEILKPLIFQSIENLAQHSPDNIQTGPAARNDMQVIDKHIQLLSSEERLRKVYEVLTQSIIASQSDKDK